jgi:hypothetical protein
MTYKQISVILYIFGMAFSTLIAFSFKYAENHEILSNSFRGAEVYFFPLGYPARYMLEHFGEFLGRWTLVGIFCSVAISTPLFYSGIGCIILFLSRRRQVTSTQGWADPKTVPCSDKTGHAPDVEEHRGTHKVWWLVSILCGAVIAIVFVTICIFLFLAMFVHSVDDLRLIDVEFVQASTLDLHRDPVDLPSPFPPNHLVGKILVATMEDIRAIARQSDLNVVSDLTICEAGAYVLTWGDLFFSGVEIHDGPDDKPINILYQERAALHKKGEPYLYEIYFEPSSTRDERKRPRLGNPDEFVPYDLSRKPIDLCLRMGGGNMLGGHFSSNTVKIPAEVIALAFPNAER